MKATSRRRIGRAILLLLLAGAWTGCVRAPLTLEEIVAKNTEAMGGAAVVESVQSIAVDLHIVDPEFEVDGTYRAARPGQMRIDINAGGKHVFTEAFDGVRGWEWKGEGNVTSETSEKATAALRHGVQFPGHLYGLHEMRQQGHQLELVGREKVEGTDYFVVRLTLKDGYVTSLYLDPAMWFITRRRDVRPLHVDIDPTPTTIEQHSTDFRKVSGVWFSFANTETDLKTGKVLETTRANSIVVNPAIEPSYFKQL